MQIYICKSNRIQTSHRREQGIILPCILLNIHYYNIIKRVQMLTIHILRQVPVLILQNVILFNFGACSVGVTFVLEAPTLNGTHKFLV